MERVRGNKLNFPIQKSCLFPHVTHCSESLWQEICAVKSTKTKKYIRIMFTLTSLNEIELRLKQKNKKTSFVLTSND